MLFYKLVWLEGKMESKEIEKETLLKFRKLEWINIKDIRPNEYNPREEISKTEVADIRDSIKEVGGILVPLVVYEENGKYVLLDGERRWRAAKDLAKYDPKYQKVPANIILGPLSENENLLTMFNIHMERKQWSTAAIAEAIGKLLEFNPGLSTRELADKMHVTSTAINEAKQFLRMPENLRRRALEGDLDEYYLILLGRSLRVCERIFPKLIKKYGWQNLAEKFIAKVDNGLIQIARDFNLISKMTKTCIQYDEEALFIKLFERMVKDERFTPADADKVLDDKLGYKVDSLFELACKNFYRSLGSYLRSRSIEKIPASNKKVLKRIQKRLAQFLKQ